MTRGYYMYIDPGPNQMNANLYKFDILNLCDSSNLNFTVWVADLQEDYARPIFEMQLLDANTQEIILQTNLITPARANNLIWGQYGFSFSLPDDVTDITFKLINKNVIDVGNDWAIDDIQVTYCGADVKIISPSQADTALCKGNSLLLSGTFNTTGTALDGRSFIYQWQHNNNNIENIWMNIENTNSLSYYIRNITEADTGYYRLKVFENNFMDNPLCFFISDSIHLSCEVCCPETLFIPNVITPSNQDGINDFFVIDDGNFSLSKELFMYNRWGKCIYHTTQYNNSWNGMINKKIAEGIYFYILIYNNDCQYHGTITVF